jgi:hypothetical protein
MERSSSTRLPLSVHHDRTEDIAPLAAANSRSPQHFPPPPISEVPLKTNSPLVTTTEGIEVALFGLPTGAKKNPHINNLVSSLCGNISCLKSAMLLKRRIEPKEFWRIRFDSENSSRSFLRKISENQSMEIGLNGNRVRVTLMAEIIIPNPNSSTKCDELEDIRYSIEFVSPSFPFIWMEN